jgi:hypothetical protein
MRFLSSHLADIQPYKRTFKEPLVARLRHVQNVLKVVADVRTQLPADSSIEEVEPIGKVDAVAAERHEDLDE